MYIEVPRAEGARSPRHPPLHLYNLTSHQRSPARPAGNRGKSRQPVIVCRACPAEARCEGITLPLNIAII